MIQPKITRMSPINHCILVIKKMLRQDIEWARDGDDGKLYIVQARPETVASQKKVGVIEEYKMLEKGILDDLEYEYGKQLEFYREMHITYEAYRYTCVQLCTVLYYVIFVQFSVLLIV